MDDGGGSLTRAATLDSVILHSLRAIRDSLPSDSALSAQNCSFGFLSRDRPFEMVEDEGRIQSYLDQLPPLQTRSAATEELARADGDGMDVDVVNVNPGETGEASDE